MALHCSPCNCFCFKKLFFRSLKKSIFVALVAPIRPHLGDNKSVQSKAQKTKWRMDGAAERIFPLYAHISRLTLHRTHTHIRDFQQEKFLSAAAHNFLSNPRSLSLSLARSLSGDGGKIKYLAGCCRCRSLITRIFN
jgi:hypothetical protein